MTDAILWGSLILGAVLLLDVLVLWALLRACAVGEREQGLVWGCDELERAA